jgi:enoyl-CoA hydratase/carnithine racemase
LILSTHVGDELIPNGLKLARKIAAASPVAVRLTTKALRLPLEQALQRGLFIEADAQALCYTSADFKEGIDAVKSKRSPNFANLK